MLAHIVLLCVQYFAKVQFLFKPHASLIFSLPDGIWRLTATPNQPTRGHPRVQEAASKEDPSSSPISSENGTRLAPEKKRTFSNFSTLFFRGKENSSIESKGSEDKGGKETSVHLQNEVNARIHHWFSQGKEVPVHNHQCE